MCSLGQAQQPSPGKSPLLAFLALALPQKAPHCAQCHWPPEQLKFSCGEAPRRWWLVLQLLARLQMNGTGQRSLGGKHARQRFC